jgi:hypothetical protein
MFFGWEKVSTGAAQTIGAGFGFALNLGKIFPRFKGLNLLKIDFGK